MIILAYVFKSGLKPIDALVGKSIVLCMLFLQTVGPYFFPGFIGHIDQSVVPGGTWSLAVEEIFYIIAPLLIMVIMRVFDFSLVKTAKVLGILVIFAIPVRLFMTRNFMPDDPNWHFASFIQFYSRYDELLIGVICAILVRSVSDFHRFTKIFAYGGFFLFVIFLAFLAAHPIYFFNIPLLTRDTIWLPTLLGIAGGCFILSIYRVPVKYIVIVVIARLSYPLYLTHILVFEMAKQSSFFSQSMVAHLGYYGSYFILIIISLALSLILSLTVEFPFIRIYKKRRHKVPQALNSV